MGVWGAGLKGEGGGLINFMLLNGKVIRGGVFERGLNRGFTIIQKALFNSALHISVTGA